MKWPAPYQDLNFSRERYRHAMTHNAWYMLSCARIAKADGNTERSSAFVAKARTYMHHALTVTAHA